MQQKILINDYPIEATNVQLELTKHYKLTFDFLVTHEDYHDVTTLLYKNDFLIDIPEIDVRFPAVISNYSTSVTNLYEAGSEGEFHLELTEKQ